MAKGLPILHVQQHNRCSGPISSETERIGNRAPCRGRTGYRYKNPHANAIDPGCDPLFAVPLRCPLGQKRVDSFAEVAAHVAFQD